MAKEITCSLCRRMFTCERGIRCWCGAVEASKEKLRVVKAEADDCVCPGCLGGSVK